MNVFWFIPTSGDGHWLGADKGARAASLPYLGQIARAVDDLGYGGVLLPTSRDCEDAWVTASMLATMTRRLRFLVAMRPGLISPTLAARMSSAFDNFSDGRLLINVVTGGNPIELAGDGVHLDHDGRYEVTDEFLTAWRGLMQGETVDLEGKHIHVEGAQLLSPPVQRPYPALYFGGSSPAAHAVAAKHVDVYLTWGEPPARVAEKIQDMRARVAAQGRTMRFGIRLHAIVRETDAEAWAAADDLIRYVDDATIAQAQQTLAQHDSHGQQRMRALQGSGRAELELSPNLWAGVGLVRSGAGTALVGDPATVAARMQEYADLGIDTFIMSGYPHLEEAYRFAELVFPLIHLDSVADTAATARREVRPVDAMDTRVAARRPLTTGAGGA